MRRALWVSAFFLLSIRPLVAAPAPIQSYDLYKSWFAVCDNGLACVAKTVGEFTASEMTISREAGPSGGMTVELAVSPKAEISAFRVDGQPLKLGSPAWQVTTTEDITTVKSSDPEAIRGLVGQLRQAKAITIGDEEVVSLGGLTAALLRIDDRQGRVGTQSALVQPGNQPASAVPPAPAYPRIPFHPIAETISPEEARRLEAKVRRFARAIFRKEECDTDSLVKAAEIFALDSGKALIFVECLQGAYQASSLAFIASRQSARIRQVILATRYPGASPQTAKVSWFTNASFEPKTGELGMFAKGRGLTDCGMSAGWIWNGREFVLAEMSSQDWCGGVYPGDWPVLFRSIR